MPDPTPHGGPIREPAAPFDATPNFSSTREKVMGVTPEMIAAGATALAMQASGPVVCGDPRSLLISVFEAMYAAKDRREYWCEQCGRPYMKPHKPRAHKPRFCSNTCKTRWHRKVAARPLSFSTAKRAV